MSITDEQIGKLPALIESCRTSGDHATLAAAATDLLAEVKRLRAELAKIASLKDEAEAVIIHAQDALTTDHPVWWVLDDYDGSGDSIVLLKRQRDEARAELADAHTALGSLGSQLAAVKAERDELRGIARALRITVVEMLSGKQPTAARAMVWQSTLKYATEALSADEPGESEDDNPSCQQGCGKTAVSWGVCDDHMPDVPSEPTEPDRATLPDLTQPTGKRKIRVTQHAERGGAR